MKTNKFILTIKLSLISIFVTFFTSCNKENLKEQIQQEQSGVVFHQFMIDGNQTTVKEINGEYYISNDEVLSERQFNILKKLAKDGIGTTERSTIISDFVKRWTNGVWYYQIASNRGAEIQEAMNWISNNSNVRFVERTVQSQYVTIYDAPITASGSSSNHVGMETGTKQINIHPNQGVGTIAHEILHSLGIFHEQSRPDRDNFIQVYMDRLPNDPNIRYQYEINPLSQGIGTFDFNSIMLYSSIYNGAVIMETLGNASTWSAQRSHLSTGDIEGLAYLYGPKITGPNLVCNEGTYTVNAGTVSLANSSGIATLTSLGNGQYKVTRTGSANGVVTLTSTIGTSTSSKNISVGGFVTLGIKSMRSLQSNATADRFVVLEGNGNYKYSGTLEIENVNKSVPTTYSWSLLSGSTGAPFINWHASGNSVTVESKASGRYVRLQCVATSGCFSFTKEYTFYTGFGPM